MKRTNAPRAGFSADTQILTRRGWAALGDLDGRDELATLTGDERFEWQQLAERHLFPFDGEMVEFRGRAVDLLVTPDYRILTRRRKLKRQREAGTHTSGHDWHFREAAYFVKCPGAVFEVLTSSHWTGLRPAEFIIPGHEAGRRHPAWEEATEWLAGRLTAEWTPSADLKAEARGLGISRHALQAARRNLGVSSRRRAAWWETSRPTRRHIPVSGAYQPAPELRIPMKDFCAFLGLYVAEGWVRKDRNDILIAQAPTSRHLPEIRKILDATGLWWSYDGKNGKFTASHKGLRAWLHENCGYRAWNKRVPDGFKDHSPDLLEVMLRGMMIGDGFWAPAGQRRYPTTSSRLADDVQEIFQKTGRDARVYPLDLRKYPATMAARPSFVVLERQRGLPLLPRPALREHHGLAGGVTVPNGVVYARRNGIAIWATA